MAGSPTPAGAGVGRAGARRGGEAVPAGDRRAGRPAAPAARHRRRRSGTPTSAAWTYLTRYPGFYQTADAGYVDEDGYLFVMGRTDDIINVAGHRLSTGAIEEVLAAHPDVAECAVFGVADALKGQVPIGMVVLKAGVERAAGRCARSVELVRERIGPVAAYRDGDRRAPAQDPLRQDPARDHAPDRRRRRVHRPATIDDPAILDEIAAVLDPH